MATHNITSFAYRAPLRYSFSVANFPYAPKIPPTISGVYPATGPTAGGGTALIVGSGFFGVTEVRFGEEAVPFAVQSDGVILVEVIPPGEEGLIDIHVIHPNNGAPIMEGAYTYLTPTPEPQPPHLENVEPEAGEPIQKSQAVSFDVVDADSEAVFITVTNESEVVFDGAGFVGLYKYASTREEVENGWRFTVSRYGGWIVPPKLKVVAIDDTGKALEL